MPMQFFITLKLYCWGIIGLQPTKTRAKLDSLTVLYLKQIFYDYHPSIANWAGKVNFVTFW